MISCATISFTTSILFHDVSFYFQVLTLYRCHMTYDVRTVQAGSYLNAFEWHSCGVWFESPREH
jgi:hypothetical protein